MTEVDEVNKRVMRLCNRLDDMFDEDTAQHRNALQDEVLKLSRYIASLEAVADAARAYRNAELAEVFNGISEASTLTILQTREALRAALATTDGGDATKKGA